MPAARRDGAGRAGAVLHVGSGLVMFREIVARARAVRAPQLVAAIALRSLLSFLPMLLLAAGIVGVVARGRVGLADDVVDWFGLTGSFADVVRSAVARGGEGGGSVVAVVVSSALLLPAALGVFQAVATACDAVWQVPDRGVVDKLLGIPWVLGAVVVVAGSVAATSLVTVIDVAVLGPVAALVGSAVAGAALCVWTYSILTNARLPARAHLPGAVVMGTVVAVVQVAGTALMRWFLRSAEVWGAFAGVFAFIALLQVIAQTIVWSAVVNVVVWERRHGTIQLSAVAPALGDDRWVRIERGGSRARLPRQRGSGRRAGR